MKRKLCFVLAGSLMVMNMPVVAHAEKNVKVKNVNGNVLTIPVGSSFSLKTNMANKNISFTSSKDKIAVVSGTGMVTAKKKGTTIVSLKDKKSKNVKKLKIKVQAPKEYVITKVSGTYYSQVKVRVKAKKGYQLYYSTDGTFHSKNKICATKSKNFTFQKSTKLNIYAFKKGEKITNLAKAKKKIIYTYVIKKQVVDSEETTKENTTTSEQATTATTKVTEAATTVAATTAETATTTAETTTQMATTTAETTSVKETVAETTAKETTSTAPTTTVKETTSTAPTTIKETTSTAPTTTIKETTSTVPTTIKETTSTAPTTTVKETTSTAPTTTVKETTSAVPTTTVKETTSAVPTTTEVAETTSIPEMTTIAETTAEPEATTTEETSVEATTEDVTTTEPEATTGETSTEETTTEVEPTAPDPTTEETTSEEQTSGEFPTDETRPTMPEFPTDMTRPTMPEFPTDETTEEITTEETSTEEASTEEASTEEATTEEASTEEASTEETSTEEASTEEATTEETSTEESTTGATEETTTEQETTEAGKTESSYAEIQEDGKVQVVIGNAPEKKVTLTNDAGEEILSISKKNKVTISKAGTYRITSDQVEMITGRIEVDAEDADVNVILAGVQLTSDDTDGVFTVKKKTASVNVTLEEGTVNKFADTAETGTETNEETGAETTVYPDGAIVSKQTGLTIQGTGKLYVSSKLGSGIKSTDSLQITNADIVVTEAGNNGISGKTELIVKDSSLDITSDSDGLKTTTPDDTTLGNMELTNTKIKIQCNEDGIQCYKDAVITDCDIDIQATKDTSKLTTVDGETKNSFKGIKAEGNLTISGGTFNIVSSDDAIHSNATIEIKDDPEMNLNTGDDGIHADDELTIQSGNITVEQSYEGLEAANIVINGGEIHVKSSDDGINAAGGSDGNTNGGNFGDDTFGPGRPGGNQGGNQGGMPGQSSGNYSIEINGGKIYVDASGDGIDSNGNITMTAGEVYVSGPTNGGNGALDYDGTFLISGGTLIAAGSIGMDQTPSDTSTQNSVRFQLQSVQQAGTKIELKDSEGNVVVSFTPEKVFQSVVISAPELTVNESYSLYLNDTLSTTVELTGTVTGGGNNGGGFGPGQRW